MCSYVLMSNLVSPTQSQDLHINTVNSQNPNGFFLFFDSPHLTRTLTLSWIARLRSTIFFPLLCSRFSSHPWASEPLRRVLSTVHVEKHLSKCVLHVLDYLFVCTGLPDSSSSLMMVWKTFCHLALGTHVLFMSMNDPYMYLIACFNLVCFILENLLPSTKYRMISTCFLWIHYVSRIDFSISISRHVFNCLCICCSYLTFICR